MISNFFGCEVCRLNFVTAYDACALDRCTRLKNEDMSLEEWIQFPLWLFETHNAVNARLLQEEAERQHQAVTHLEEIARRWPDQRDCPKCWKADGSWDEMAVFKFLRVEYWPDDGWTAQYRSEVGNDEEDDDTVIVSFFSPLVFRLMPFGIALAGFLAYYFRKMERRRSGMHKKSDECPA